MFDVSQLKSPLIHASFNVNGGTIEADLDADLITGAFLEEMRDKAQKQVDAGTLVEESKQIRFMAEVLSRLIKSWTVTNNGLIVAASVDFFMSLPVALVGKIFELAMAAINPVENADDPKPVTAPESAPSIPASVA